MQTRTEAVAEVQSYIADKLREGVSAEITAAEIVDADDGSGHGEVSARYTASGNPLVVSFTAVTVEK
jgi:hypothetical protein